MVIDSEVKELVKKAEENHGDQAAYYLAATILWLEDYCGYLERDISRGYVRRGPRSDSEKRKDH